jgi:dephospho-CoA kinase
MSSAPLSSAPLQVGLTGNVASGKSTVARVWASAGVPVVSADGLARDAVAPDSPGLREVVEAFGPQVLRSDGTLDRDHLRERVFQDPEARKRLEAILHPRIQELREAWLRERREERVPLVVSEIPLLFETGLEGEVDLIVFVDAPEDERRRRLVEDRGLPPEEANRIMAAQGDPGEKRRRSHLVLKNDGSLDALQGRARTLLEELRAHSPESTPMRLDLHLHTRGSWDSLSDPEAVLARARERGIHRIAITDHNRLQVAREMHQRHPDAVIPGEEVKTAEGIDVIGLYLSTEIPKGTPMEETCRRIRDQGGIVYLPHPYAAGKGGSGRFAEELAPQVDVVEVMNARLRSRRRNQQGLELALRQGRLQGAGSDAHTVGEVGNAWVEVARHPNEPGALLHALEKARIHGQRAPLHVFLASNWAKVRKRFS